MTKNGALLMGRLARFITDRAQQTCGSEADHFLPLQSKFIGPDSRHSPGMIEHERDAAGCLPVCRLQGEVQAKADAKGSEVRQLVGGTVVDRGALLAKAPTLIM